ncbi:SNAPIN protein homolog [Teleopsis dalmanni]|uniref:SNAPIN protein homolog n=1 Tax=Teleopsis dalmanni TaxID=139649 RepID=UPI0018CD8ED6|nr:SNAPIN protein homolog [Teleopsis dalmanni]
MDKDSDSTVTSLDENTENFCTNQTRDILAEGILNLFKPSVERLDERIHATKAAQAELKVELDALFAQLREIEKAQHNIPEFSDKVKELINVKHKVTVITNILTNSQERLAGLHKLIEKEQRRRQALLDSALSTNIS